MALAISIPLGRFYLDIGWPLPFLVSFINLAIRMGALSVFVFLIDGRAKQALDLAKANKALQEDILERQRMLEKVINVEKLASVGKLAACVAHEIRNPLTSMKMRLFSVRKAIGNDPQYEDDFQVVSEEISRLESVIHNFLEFSRPPELDPQPYSISQLIDKTVELYGHRFEEENIRLVCHVGSSLPRVMVDIEQVKQVIINLFDNAVEAMEEGGDIRVSTALELYHHHEPMVVVRFQDSGPGIPEDLMDRVFEPFYSTKEGGTGLGLYIAARIMERHGGRLELESPTDRGTSFALWIPTVQTETYGQDPCR